MTLQETVSQFDQQLGQCDACEVTSDVTVQLMHATSKLAALLVLRESSPSECEHWVQRLSVDFERCLTASTKQFFMNDSGAKRNTH
ncbi:hypothetical protein [Piscirickettsia salmonis]|uniref:hypothetical protein n=1 Tax=Piscirickettsia salmonis TaxID=1238 RepID=UPI0006BC53FD|nr:hypothetical protein [Piscirickettsia salmonis]ALA26630.1 excinuclease ABC subunit C [Piscirickettsia salmonis]APS49274.1 hypothetical protein AVI49_16590 [Piscirickettsia salmonis]QGO82339.1 hypothetical protein Psal107_03390 [Piscirickettsia salmonis]QGP24168.1 hypothetical protein Psal158_03342 [Piscirickettsia salmonis]QGP27594.1 hypothetical protein Psal159_03387 [Piscirickettsia salmonis]